MSAPLVLVTGGSRGIGAAVCRLCARDGWRVAVNYRDDADSAEAVVAAIRRAGGTAQAFCADVGDPRAIESLFAAVDAALGPPLALVNNAGVTGGLGPFAELRLEALRRVMDLNVVGTMLCAQQAIRRWLRDGTPGRVVNVSSIAATTGAPGEYVHYAASKAAVEAFTTGLAKEVARHGIRVNAVAPGTTRTGIHAAGGDPDRADRVASRIPLGRAAEPTEIAEAIVWLLSDEASYVTGATLSVAGGS